MTVYQPGPAKRPLLLRPQPWAGGLSLAGLALVLALGVPLVWGGCALVWAADGAYHGETARSR